MPIWHIPTFRSFFLLEALLSVGLSLRPLHEDVSVEAEGLRTEVCGGIRCFTFSYSGRINQGHFVMKPEDTQKLAWKLKAGSKYALHSSQDCLENHLLASASVVPWIDRDNPTQASTIEVFVDPKKIWNLSQSQDVANHAFLCASEMHHSLKSTCLCSLRLGGKRDRFLARLAGPSLMKVSGIADVQLAAERRCDSLLLPEVAALVLLALALCNVLVSGEALVARHRFITQTHHPNDNVRQELVLQSSPNAKLYHGTSLAVGFTTLTITMQTLAARIIVQVGAAEPLVHSMIWAALAFGVCGIWLFYTTLCRNQLVQSCLGLKICICNVPSTKRITSLMVGTVFGYVLVISGCLLRSVDSLPEAIKVVAAVVSSVVGPTMGILKAFRNSLEAEQADVQVKMQVDDFKDVIQAAGGRAAEASNKSPNHRFGGWSFVPWSAVVSSCRRGSFPDHSLEIDGGATSPDEGSATVLA